MNLKIIALLVFSLFLLCGLASAEGMVDTKMHSIVLLNKAAKKHQYRTEQPLPHSHNARLRESRNSSVGSYHSEPGGGVSIGNIYTHPGSTRQHHSTVIVTGPIIVSGKK